MSIHLSNDFSMHQLEINQPWICWVFKWCRGEGFPYGRRRQGSIPKARAFYCRVTNLFHNARLRALSTEPWQRRTNLWRERTNLRTGSERLRGVIRRLDPEALAFFGLGHRWWRHPRPRMLRSSPEQSLALHRCLLEKDTNEETATRQRACDCKFPWLRPRRQFVFNDAAA